MHVVVTPDEAGKRADVLIAHHTGFSRSLVAEAVRRGDVRVNGAAVKGSHLVAEGDVLEAHLIERPPLAVDPEAIDLTIVFEDDDVLVVDKPAGMVTHPAHGATSGTLVNALLAHVASLPGEAVRAGLVHRLDRDTSGLLVVAKTDAALSALGKAMKARYISREYLGLAAGIPIHAKGTIDGADRPRSAKPFALRNYGGRKTRRHALRSTRTFEKYCRSALSVGNGANASDPRAHGGTRPSARQRSDLR